MQSNQKGDNSQSNNRNRSRGQQNSSSNQRNQAGNSSHNVHHHPPAPPAAEKGSARTVSKTDGLKAILKAPASAAPASEVEKRDIGVIASIRSAFGFIHSIFSDDTIYFSEREFYSNMKVGDLLSYVVKSGPKGLAAQNAQLLSSATDSFRVVTANVKGTVTRSYERHRSNFGLIEIEVDGLPAELKSFFQTQTNNAISFRVTDVAKESLPRNHFLDRGDYVKFSILSVKDNVFYLAGNVELIQLKRDRAIALQIQRMLDAGAVRERGVVSAVKNQEYGFIRAQDRKDEIYFRIDDVGNEDKPQIKEGIEVEFFVIAEMIRGKLCDRAIHLNIIPTGTVQFEVIISTEVLVTVIQEPGLPPNDEVPGMAQLDEELDISKLVPNTKIKHIDLWQRCLPDDLLVRPGDRLQVNIHFYRPEKLYFARNVKVVEFFSFGRDVGTICAIKDQAFGFIRSELRKADLYFKTTQVLGISGDKMVAESELKKGMKVFFDCSTEESSKLRAVRVQIMSETQQQVKSNDEEKYILQKNLLGVVTRNAVKRDAIGLLRVSPAKFKEIQEITFHDPEISIVLDNFMKIPSFTSIDIPALPEFLRKSFREVITSNYPSLNLEDLASPDFHDYNNSGSGQLKTLRIFKKSSAQQSADSVSSSQKGGNSNPPANNSNSKETNPNHIQFMKDDYVSEELGPLGNDMEVFFDLVYDKYRGKKVAKNIRLTDEEITVTSGDETIGVIDSIIDSSNSYKAGFIRVLSSDEKIFWVTKNTSNNNNGATPSNNLVVGAAVKFDLRKRGGLRTAVNLTVLSEAPTKQETLSSICTALVVPSAANANAMEVVLVDTSCEANLQYKYVDLKLLENLFAAHQPNAPSASSTASVAPAAPAASVTAESATVASPPPSKPSEDITGEVSPVNTTSSDRVEYKAKYFPALYRLPLPINETVQSLTVTGMKPGDLVTCQPVVNWTQQRGPINAVVLDTLTSNTLKKRGKITKLKFRMKQIPTSLPSALIPSHVSLDHLAHYRLNELDFTEIQEIPDKNNLSKQSEEILQINKDKNPSASFVCLFHEIFDVNNNNNNGSSATGANNTAAVAGQHEPLAAGEKVEFYVIPTIPNIAFGVQTLPKKDFGFSSTSKGPGINDKLKLKIAGTNLITMAQGPPTDSAQGFEAGWRGETTINVSGLPWASLLAHLQ